MKRTHGLGFALLIALPLPVCGGETIDFRKDIEPIMQKHCTRCHGAEKRKGGLLLNARKAALLPADSGRAAIVPGDAHKSELLRRVLSLDKDERMPPAGDRLTASEIARLRAWIEQGAAWPEAKNTKHWAYLAPVRPALPSVQKEGWAKTPIDCFVLARLEKEKLAPAPAAETERLIRRVYLDLIGLPPTPAEVDDFLKDVNAKPPALDLAYEKVANRLGLARWLVDAKNPLVARVTVNRWWAEFFGHGLVGTLEDFGSQSDAPTHAELLDWLAVEFMSPARTPAALRLNNAWSMKRIRRLIVTSATYLPRQT